MKLFYRKYGNGPPLIILHGLFGSSDNWVTIAKRLGDTFTTYLPDQRNHGQSPRSDINDYSSMRDDLFELVTDLRFKKIFLAGHSMGGKVAISFALKWPEMLNGLLIADISPFVNDDITRSAYKEHSTVLNAMLSIDLTRISSRGEAELMLKGKITSEKVRGLILKNLQRTSENKFEWKINAPSLLSNLDNIMEGIEREGALTNQITGFPVLFLKGEKSDYLPQHDLADIMRVFPAAEFVNIHDAGHWVHSDRPDEVIMNLKRLSEES